MSNGLVSVWVPKSDFSVSNHRFRRSSRHWPSSADAQEPQDFGESNHRTLASQTTGLWRVKNHRTLASQTTGLWRVKPSDFGESNHRTLASQTTGLWRVKPLDFGESNQRTLASQTIGLWRVKPSDFGVLHLF